MMVKSEEAPGSRSSARASLSSATARISPAGTPKRPPTSPPASRSRLQPGRSELPGPNSSADAQVLFTSALDNTATTFYFNPVTQQDVTIVPAISVLNTPNPTTRRPPPFPTATLGSVDRLGRPPRDRRATFQFGAGSSICRAERPLRNVLTLFGSRSTFQFTPPAHHDPLATATITMVAGLGSRSMITNDNFYDNANEPICRSGRVPGGGPGDPVVVRRPRHPWQRHGGERPNGVGINVPVSPDWTLSP